MVRRDDLDIAQSLEAREVAQQVGLDVGRSGLALRELDFQVAEPGALALASRRVDMVFRIELALLVFAPIVVAALPAVPGGAPGREQLRSREPVLRSGQQSMDVQLEAVDGGIHPRGLRLATDAHVGEQPLG